MRLESHPILRISRGEPFAFTFGGEELSAYEGETISAALFAQGVRIFGRHYRDGAPQGIFCANGQCAQCMVVADGLPVKSCMTPVRPGMRIEPLDGLPVLPRGQAVTCSTPASKRVRDGAVQVLPTEVLIIGGGPAGMSAAIELGRRGIAVILIDDKDRLGGKLVLQTHRFFGSIEAVYAGRRGIDIATLLADQVREHTSVDIWLRSTALAVFSDRVVGVLRDEKTYALIRPQALLIAAGAREKSLSFRGNTLPGVYGAGAFQTLVNRDLVRAADRLFIVGGGNVGLIAGYHALQAGIEVVGLVEALPECGGYKVHRDKLARLGVPIYTSHTILSANGTEQVESVTIAKIDEAFRPIPGTERSFSCDTALIAVGLDPVDEFYQKAQEYGMNVFAAGDAEEIAEASAAIFSGKIKGVEIANAVRGDESEIPAEWALTAEALRSRPGETVVEEIPTEDTGIFPVLHCRQEIPCNPCTSVCPYGLIEIDGTDIRSLPWYIAERTGKECIGCGRCVIICPGLAITLVDYREEGSMPVVSIAYELAEGRIAIGDKVTVLDTEGTPLGKVETTNISAVPGNDHTVIVKVKAPKDYAKRIAGIRIQAPAAGEPLPEALERLTDDTIVCRCERVSAAEIRALIREGYRDINEIKAVTRALMGSCGGKTCAALIERLFREEGIPAEEIAEEVKRPLFIEVSLGTFAGMKESGR